MMFGFRQNFPVDIIIGFKSWTQDGTDKIVISHITENFLIGSEN